MAEEAGKSAGAPSGGSKLPLILALVNSIALMAAAGTAVYTRLMFQRPKITEEAERARLEALHSRPRPAPSPALISFDPITINLKPAPGGDDPTLGGKYHYLTVGLNLQIRDESRKDEVEQARAFIMDRFLSIMGRKGIAELNSVSGRLNLKAQVVDMANDLVSKGSSDEDNDTEDGKKPERSNLVSDVYFSQFTLQ